MPDSLVNLKKALISLILEYADIAWKQGDVEKSHQLMKQAYAFYDAEHRPPLLHKGSSNLRRGHNDRACKAISDLILYWNTTVMAEPDVIENEFEAWDRARSMPSMCRTNVGSATGKVEHDRDTWKYSNSLVSMTTADDTQPTHWNEFSHA